MRLLDRSSVKWRGWLFPLSCVCLLAATACKPARPNVLLVTFDTTRWDHVGYAAGKPGLTPMLDAMAKRGTWFSQAISAQPLTVPSHTTIMTGLFPYHHGVRNNGTYIVPQEDVTLAERLKAVGYQTHAVVSSFVLDSQFGLDQGFDEYDDDLSGGPRQKMFMFKEIKAERTAAKGALWLRSSWKREQPFFMWMHFFDPHADYEPPQDVAAKFPGDPYSGEIHYADRELGRIFKELDELKQLDNTLVIFVADHGDSLGEHGEKTHGLFIYDSTTHVPLFMAGPGVKAGGVVNEVVRTADIVPTVMDLLGLSGADKLDGRSLKPLWNGSSDQRTAYIETFVPRENFGWSELRALRTGHQKAIQAPRPELYRLEPDPHELNNLRRADELHGAAALPGDAQALVERLYSLKTADPYEKLEHSAAGLNDEARRKLNALGYVTDSVASSSKGPRPDPKDRIHSWESFQDSQGLIRRKQYPQAIAALTQLLQEDPGNLTARGSLATALAQSGDKEKALELYREMREQEPRSETAWLAAAKILRELGRFSEAEPLVRKVIEVHPATPDAYTALGDVFLDQQRYQDAEPFFRKAIEIDPHSSLAATGLGNCLNRAGRLDEASSVLSAARQRDPSSHSVTYNLAVVREHLGDVKGALELYKAAIRLDPDHSMSWNNLGSLLDRDGQHAEALKFIQKAHELDPENVEATYNLGALLLAGKQPDKALPYLETASRQRPDLAQAHMQLARALQALGRTDDALAVLKILAARNPGAWLAVAQLERKTGDETSARQALAEGVKAGGDRFRKAAERDPELKGLLEQGL